MFVSKRPEQEAFMRQVREYLGVPEDGSVTATTVLPTDTVVDPAS